MSEFTALRLRAAAWDGQSEVRLAEGEEALALFMQPDRLVWLQVEGKDAEQGRALLAGRLGFNELAVEDALHRNEHPMLHVYGEMLYLELAEVIERPNNEAYGDIGLFAAPGQLVSYSENPSELVRECMRRWSANPAHYGPTPGHLLHAIADEVVDRYFPASDHLEASIDRLSDKIFTGKEAAVPELVRIKRRLLDMRRRISPIRDVLNSCLRRDIVALPNELKPYFQDVYDHTLRIIEILDTNREVLASVFDAHLALISNNLNLVMRTMTVIATVLMSATLVAGIYGMNFVAMPELKWPYGYAFALGLMLLISFGELWYFRRKRWI